LSEALIQGRLVSDSGIEFFLDDNSLGIRPLLTSDLQEGLETDEVLVH